MKRTSLTKYAKDNIREIHALSSLYNGKGGKHAEKLLFLVRKHSKEITALYEAKDPHFSVETGDLMVLCLELLREVKAPDDVIMEKCYGRYRKKLRELLGKTQAPPAKGGKK